MRTIGATVLPHRPGLVTPEGLVPKTAVLALFTLCGSPDLVISACEIAGTGRSWTTLALAGSTITVVEARSPVPWPWRAPLIPTVRR